MAVAEVVRLGSPSGPGGAAVPGSGLDLGPGKVGGAIPVLASWSRGQVELRPVRSGDGACGDGMPGPACI